MSIETEKTGEARSGAQAPDDVSKREVLAKLGKYAAYTAPVMLITFGASGRKAEAQTETENCFTATTQVLMADRTTRPICAVKIGDEVIGENGKVHKVIDREVHVLGSRKLFSFNGGPAFVTPEHPFMTREGWKSMDPIATLAETKSLLVGVLRLGDEIVQFAPVARGMELEAIGAAAKGPSYLESSFETIFAEIRSIASSEADPALRLCNLKLEGGNSYFADNYLVHTK